MMAKCVAAVFRKWVQHLHTNKRWKMYEQKKGKAGTHAATSAIRRSSAQQRSWVIEWLHGVLVALWPAFHGSAAFLENTSERGKKKKDFNAHTGCLLLMCHQILEIRWNMFLRWKHIPVSLYNRKTKYWSRPTYLSTLTVCAARTWLECKNIKCMSRICNSEYKSMNSSIIYTSFRTT